jgi:hypothetical protein
MTLNVIETNQSIKLVLSLIDSTSHDASNALRFRLQRNVLPSLTDEGNITPGLVCDATTTNDPDAKFILLVNNNSTVSTPQSAKFPTNSSKLLQLPMPLAAKKTNTNDKVRSNEVNMF